jgi:hypothetical protein
LSAYTVSMIIFARMHLLRKPLVLGVFLFIVIAAHSEIPEQIRLRDDVSNDFVMSACWRQPVQPRSVSQDVAPSGPAEAVPTQTVQDFRFPSVAKLFHLSGRDRLLRFSIERT